MTDSLLDQLTLQLLSTLDLDAEGSDDAPGAAWPLLAWIGITGAPAYQLEIGLTPAAALRLSGLITGLTPADVIAEPGLSQDLANEIANVLAGNLWPALEGATGIQLPAVGAPPRRSAGRVARAYPIDGTPGLMVALGERED